jgi:nucleoside 2-deoxyribosyltransferase
MGDPTMGRKAFLAGPIQGMEKNQSYRDDLRSILLHHGFEPVDPWQREKVVYSATGHDWWRNVPPADFIRRDLEDIDRCNLFVAYLPKLSAGTCMELFYAKRKGKKTAVICQIENPSPWIMVHSDILLGTIKDFEELLKAGSL